MGQTNQLKDDSHDFSTVFHRRSQTVRPCPQATQYQTHTLGTRRLALMCRGSAKHRGESVVNLWWIMGIREGKCTEAHDILGSQEMTCLPLFFCTLGKTQAFPLHLTRWTGPQQGVTHSVPTTWWGIEPFAKHGLYGLHTSPNSISLKVSLRAVVLKEESLEGRVPHKVTVQSDLLIKL